MLVLVKISYKGFFSVTVQSIGTPYPIMIIILKLEKLIFFMLTVHMSVNNFACEKAVHSAGPDQTAPCRSSLIWVCTVYVDISAPLPLYLNLLSLSNLYNILVFSVLAIACIQNFKGEFLNVYN